VGAIMMRGAAITVGGIAILMLRELMLAYAAVVIYSGFRLASAPPIGHGQDDDLGGNSIIRTVRQCDSQVEASEYTGVVGGYRGGDCAVANASSVVSAPCGHRVVFAIRVQPSTSRVATAA
jgi:hypothetical protein